MSEHKIPLMMKISGRSQKLRVLAFIEKLSGIDYIYVCHAEKHTKHSSILILRSVRFSAWQTLIWFVSKIMDYCKATFN